MIFGKGSEFGSEIELQALDGNNGFILNASQVLAFSSERVLVSSAGDVNGDGIDDIIVSTPSAEGYVVFGTTEGFSNVVETSNLDGSNGFVIIGDFDNFRARSSAISSAGDVNGDGFDDLIIGVTQATPNDRTYAGESYVVFGRSEFGDRKLLLQELDGSNGFVLNGIEEENFTGSSVSSAGDINGDGFDDVITSTISNNIEGKLRVGESYVVFGSDSTFNREIELKDLDGINGFAVTGLDSFDYAGTSISSAGDINADGFDDVIIGARGRGPKGENFAGASYVIFGSNSKFDSNLDLQSLNGNNGFVVNGANAFDRSGSSVSNAGDVNGDGVDDIIIGAFNADPNDIQNAPNPKNRAGESYIIFGSNTPLPDNAPPTAKNDFFTVNEDAILQASVFADNGSGQDTDPEGDFFTVTEVNGIAMDVGNTIKLPSLARLTINADGTFSYDPVKDVQGTQTNDTFSYSIEGSNGGFDTGLVNITIN
ncbi:MAG: Ig-like domain-containing protein [Cyanobacteria bacterium P01_D01_bin.36]